MLQEAPLKPNTTPEMRFDRNEKDISTWNSILENLQKELKNDEKTLALLKKEHDNENLLKRGVNVVKEALLDTDYEKKVRELGSKIQQTRKNINLYSSMIDNCKNNQKELFEKNPDLALAVFNKIFKPKIEGKSYSQLSSGTKMIYFNESGKDGKLQIIKIVSGGKESSFIKEGNNFYLSVNQNSRELIRNDSLYVFIHKLNTEVNTAIDMENKKIEHEKHAKNQEIRRNIELAENSARGQEIQEVENMMDDYLSIV